ncbi:MAG: biotin carboxylase, partial [Calditrichota bacterium]
GGKGMRVVAAPDKLTAAWEAARRESRAAFESDEVYLEKYIPGPRHIEVQILADKYGNCVHLYERECSIQRRHQKVIEEAPSPALRNRPDIRERLGQAAIAAAKACGYVNAGTVEFLFDGETSNFYFLEMNTRLQAEHPVTEFVTGLDLVRQQILIAQGEPLTVAQDKVKHRGCAIEARIYAEDPAAGFLPDAGRVESLVRPNGPWVRVDSGVIAGSEVGVYYDPLVAKLIVWGPTRREAIQRMRRALLEYRVTGFKTTIPFAQLVMENPRYIAGDFDTRFIEQEYLGTPVLDAEEELTRAVAVVAAVWTHQESIPVPTSGLITGEPPQAGLNGRASGWKQAGRVSELR